MKRKILICAMLLAMIGFTVPADSYAAGDQEGKNKSSRGSRDSQEGRRWNDDDNNRHGRRRMNRRIRNTHGYRNYGQYRRTQVGNRRFRTTRQYYWRNGTRLSRYTRVYY